MVLAGVLFFVAGLLNGIYPGGEGIATHGAYSWVTYVFGFLNLLVAGWIWRGSERGLLTRIGLAALFLAIVIGLALAQPSAVSLAIYVVTGLIEVVILVDAIRVWRLGRSADRRDLADIFSLDALLPIARARQPALVTSLPVEAERRATPALSARLTWVIGILALALATTLVIDGLASGFVPGATIEWGFSGRESGWLVYVYALLVLVVAVRAVHASPLALRLLLVTGLLVLIERPFSPFVIGDTSARTLVLHAVAALIALALALVSVVALRSVKAGGDTAAIRVSGATAGD